jgi:hypothetical protein
LGLRICCVLGLRTLEGLDLADETVMRQAWRI